MIDKFTPLNQQSLDNFKNKLRPGYNFDGLRYLKIKATNELNLRDLYRNRAPYELLQNADDVRATRALFILTKDGLVFAHNGNWFTIGNFESLAEGWSDKDPNECIGHKGLGFRSVLDITPAPHILRIGSQEFFATRFSWAVNNGHIQEIFSRHPELRKEYDDWTKHGRPACPIMFLPGNVKKINLGDGANIFESLNKGKYGESFTTMFWFPMGDSEIPKNVLSDLSPRPIFANQNGKNKLLNFLEKEVAILIPFLEHIEEVSVYENEYRLGHILLDGRKKGHEPVALTVFLEVNGDKAKESFFQMHFSFPIPPEIRNHAETPLTIKKTDKNKKVHVSLSVRVKVGEPFADPDAYFHVYFPTDEKTGTGFVVHGDFHVKPDRTRLMPGRYNEWLWDHAAKKAANEFLTALLARYRPQKVFESLAVTGLPSSDSASQFINFFSKALKNRKKPFIPSRVGELITDEALLPPNVDNEGFWEEHFGDSVGEVMGQKKGFISPSEDSEGARRFLKLAGLEALSEESFLDFMERSSSKNLAAEWWYDCYSYMAKSDTFSRIDNSLLIARKLILLEDSLPKEIPQEKGDIICFPPTGEISNLIQPECFKKIFVFLHKGLANIIDQGDDLTRNWVLNRLGLSKFEATDILPKAIRRIVPDIFTGKITISFAELKEVWSFIQKVTQASFKARQIEAPDFWREAGRLPVPLDNHFLSEKLPPESLVPAFLAYWPDSFIQGDNCLAGIEGLRRINEDFLNSLISETDVKQEEWKKLFQNVGVSQAPKLLNFSRMVGWEGLPFEVFAPQNFPLKNFAGERQHDENSAIIETLKNENLWAQVLERTPDCGHNRAKVLHALSLLEGFYHIIQKAVQEYQTNNKDQAWQQRLVALWRGLPIISFDDGNNTKAHCPGGTKGGHILEGYDYIKAQLQNLPWLPSTRGPVSSGNCFLRLSSRRLISSGRSETELGDILLPYVVVENSDDYHSLLKLGVESLEDAESASPSALMRALHLIGEELSMEWGKANILADRTKWRLVRGAIQEIYRVLNQENISLDIPAALKLATRSPRGVEFIHLPLYFADPGSPVEQAFKNTLPLFDADRPFIRLFERLNIIRLDRQETVTEKIQEEETANHAPSLKDEIIHGLGPFLLAPIIAKSEQDKQGEQALKKITDRFDVKTAPSLRVSFFLQEKPSVEETIEFYHFYLKQKLFKGRGAGEFHYTLFVRGSSNISVEDIDGDSLGGTLVDMFKDSLTRELVGAFPRIAARYQQLKLSRPEKVRSEMQDFLHKQLGISLEAQEKALALISGEEVVEAPAPPPPPPPIFFTPPPTRTGTESEQGQSLTDMLSSHAQQIEGKAMKQFQDFFPDTSGKDMTGHHPDSQRSSTGTTQSYEITPEQQERGWLGEEEVKKRLSLPGGYGGFIFISDRRKDGCGYDYLCNKNGIEVKLEVKTFTQNGRITMTSREIKEALLSGNNYFLVGIIASESNAGEWMVSFKQNPIDDLLEKGEFDIQTKLHVAADKIFPFQFL